DRALALVILALLLAQPRAAAAQGSVTGTLRGIVLDATGGVLTGASVRLTSTATNTSQTVVTREAGRYAFVGVLPGPYALRVELEGFKTFEQKGLDIRPQD